MELVPLVCFGFFHIPELLKNKIFINTTVGKLHDTYYWCFLQECFSDSVGIA